MSFYIYQDEIQIQLNIQYIESTSYKIIVVFLLLKK